MAATEHSGVLGWLSHILNTSARPASVLKVLCPDGSKRDHITIEGESPFTGRVGTSIITYRGRTIKAWAEMAGRLPADGANDRVFFGGAIMCFITHRDRDVLIPAKDMKPEDEVSLLQCTSAFL